MVEVLGLGSMIKHYPEAIKLIKEMLDGNISEVSPASNPATELGFTYPQMENLLGVTTNEATTILELLADEDLLERHFHDKLLFCPYCQSPNLKPTLGCPNCGSGNVAQGRVLEHSSCRNNTIEDEYICGAKYICPKCQQELKFLGTDYQSLGINYKCHECGSISKEATPNWQCLHCSRFFSQREIKEIIIYSYRFNDAGRRWH